MSVELYKPSLDWANEIPQSLLWTAKAWLITAVLTLLVLVATNLSMAIPSAPGYVGVFHGVFVATLAVFGEHGSLELSEYDPIAHAADK